MTKASWLEEIEKDAFHYEGIIYEEWEGEPLPKDIEKCETLDECLEKMTNHIAKDNGRIDGTWIRNCTI